MCSQDMRYAQNTLSAISRNGTLPTGTSTQHRRAAKATLDCVFCCATVTPPRMRRSETMSRISDNCFCIYYITEAFFRVKC